MNIPKQIINRLDSFAKSLHTTVNQLTFSGLYGCVLEKVDAKSNNTIEFTLKNESGCHKILIQAIQNEFGDVNLEIVKN